MRRTPNCAQKSELFKEVLTGSGMKRQSTIQSFVTKRARLCGMLYNLVLKRNTLKVAMILGWQRDLHVAILHHSQ